MLRSLAASLLAALVALAPRTAAQVTAEPAALAVTLETGASVTRTLTVGYDGTSAVPFCLDFAAPLQLGRPSQRSPRLVEGGCAAPREVRDSTAAVRDPYAVAMTPDGRLFVAEVSGRNRTWELTPALSAVRVFDSPTLQFSSNTTGLFYVPAEGDGEERLWWTDTDTAGPVLEYGVMIEGDLDGTPTGRSFDVPAGGPVPPFPSGAPADGAFDPTAAVADEAKARGLFFYLDPINDDVFAVDTAGAVAPGYPVPQTDYDAEADLLEGVGLDAHSGVGPGPRAGRLEITVGLPGEARVSRVVVTDRLGRNLGAETPLTDVVRPNEIVHGIARSRVDPNGALYVAALIGEAGDVEFRVYAVRPAPLAPLWLAPEAAAWAGTLTPGAPSAFELVFDASALEPGTYRDTLVVEAGDPAAPSVAAVPLSLVVLPGVANEEGAARPEAFALGAPYPNPVRSSMGVAVVPLTLAVAAEVTVSVYDVLGRRVAALHDGALASGSHRLSLNGHGLSAGLYVVRAVGDSFTEAQRFTLVR